MPKMFQQIIRKFQRPRKEAKRLVVSKDGLGLLEGEREVYRFKWTEVSKIETYKRDLGTVDMICLDFTLSAQHIVYMANDEMAGFDELTKHLTRDFPTVPVDWWSDVAFPAFATNHRILFERFRS
jgi:hypothetical protein